MDNITDVLRNVAQRSLANKEEFETLEKTVLPKNRPKKSRNRKGVSDKS